MCGIAGIWSKTSLLEQGLREIIEAMLLPVRQRGPDGHGLWYDSDRQIALGHRRLSILDLSEAGAQPMVEAVNGEVIAITFNGEIYNFQDLRLELESLGMAFRSRSDTEVILKAYIAWGEEAFKRLSGIFAFGLIDLRYGELFLVRDAIGVKPLYICRGPFGLAFGSTPSQFLAAGLAGEINPEALAGYLQRGYVEIPGCIYAHVAQVPPGQYWKIRDNFTSDVKSLFDYLEIVSANSPAERAARGDFGLLLDQVVKEQLVSDTPVGCFLSGGIDSTSVVTAMVKASVESVKTFTVGFPDKVDDEAAVARHTAHILGTNHHELIITGAEALEALSAVFDGFDEPFADASAIPTYLLSRFAREFVKVVLSGDGGDELFAGYPHYNWLRGYRPKIYVLPLAFRRFAGQFFSSLRRQDLLASPSMDEYYCMQLVKFSPREMAALWPGLKQKPLSLGTVPDNGLSPLRRGMTYDFSTYLPGDILVKTDRATMAVGLECRVPLLDTRIVKYAASLMDPQLCEGRRTKIPLRRYLTERIPTEHLDLPKRGFGIPKAQWLRGELKDHLALILESNLWNPLGTFSHSYVGRLFREHQSGAANHSNQLWTLLSLGEWNRRRMDRLASVANNPL